MSPWDESSTEAVAAAADGPRTGKGEVEQSLSVAEVAVFALGPKLIEQGDPAIAVGVVRPKDESERRRSAASAN